MSEGRLRLDQLLTDRGLARSRAHAADAIRRGAVRIQGERAQKPGRLVTRDAAIEMDRVVAREVSRGGAKLSHGLDHFGIDPGGLACLDIGASTGGFTQTLLERGAARVYAVDVGTGQLDPAIANDPRVVNLERTDARALTRAQVREHVGLIVADVSFIGLEKALPAALGLAGPGAFLVALVKPQFELGPDGVGRDGVVRDERLRDAVIVRMARWLETVSWRPLGHTLSLVPGKSGNREWLIAARSGDG